MLSTKQIQQTQKILERNGIKIIKLTPNKFNLTLDINNNNVILPLIINFDLIQLINTLNPNIFETLEIDPDTKTDIYVITNILFKDLFSDIGLPQYYTSSIVNKSILDNNKIIFNCSLFDRKLPCYPDDVKMIPIQQITIIFEIIDNHHVAVTGDVDLIENHNIPTFSEKMIGNIIYNIFYRLKQFIEKITF
jgi:hypothetical protein